MNNIAAYYDQLIQGLPLEITAFDLSNYTQLTEQIAQKLHNGTLAPEDLDEALIQQTFSSLKKAIGESWKDWLVFGDDAGKDRTVLALQRHLFRFSAAKSYAQLKEMNALLHKDGKLREWADFKKDVAQLTETYNSNYLQAEYQTARQAGHHARNWQSYVKDKDLFPALEYRTAADERVREEHAAFDGMVRAVDDPFWDEYYPPNGWRCRCYVVQTDAPVSEPRAILPEDDIRPDFKTNVGKHGTVWTQKHPYMLELGKSKKASKKAAKLESEAFDFEPKNIADHEKTYGVKIDRSIFKLLKRKVMLGVVDEPGTSGGDAYYNPSTDYIKIAVCDRFKNDKWIAKAVVYHEFAHAVDHHNGLSKQKQLLDIMSKYRKKYAAKNNAGYSKIEDALFMDFLANKKIEQHNQIGSTMDTLMALNMNFGGGHSKKYYKKKGNAEAEFIAHAFENKYVGNPYFKKHMPELYDELVAWVEGLF